LLSYKQADVKYTRFSISTTKENNEHNMAVFRVKTQKTKNTLPNTTPRVKKEDAKLLPITSSNINRFSILFSGRLSGKNFNKNHSCLNIPPHLKYVATLPCEIRMSEN